MRSKNVQKIVYATLCVGIMLPSVTSSGFNLSKSSRSYAAFKQSDIEVSLGIIDGYGSPSYGFPYSITVKNGSKKSIEVGPLLISNPLATYAEITKSSNSTFYFLYTFLAVGFAAAGLGVAASTKFNKYAIGTVTALTWITFYTWLSSLKKSAQSTWNEWMFYAPVTIAPGEEMIRMF